jgi:hypothetical protein
LLEKPGVARFSGAQAPSFLGFLQFFSVFGRQGPETGSDETGCTTIHFAHGGPAKLLNGAFGGKSPVGDFFSASLRRGGKPTTGTQVCAVGSWHVRQVAAEAV